MIQVLQLMLTALGVMPPAGITAGGMLSIAVVIALAVLTIALSLATPIFGIRSAPHPRRAIDVSTRLAQSDPDAAGHRRPRAPGVATA